jgi:hypothetical protein
MIWILLYIFDMTSYSATNSCAILCNYGDNFWTEKNISQLVKIGIFGHFTVIDQNTLPKSKFLGLKPLQMGKASKIKVIRNLETKFEHASYQHAEAIEKSLYSLNCDCENVWIIDTDLFMSKHASEWLVSSMDTYDAIFMQDPKQLLLSHPCLAIIKRSLLTEAEFKPSEIDLISTNPTKRRLVDTGRILAATLSKKGFRVAIVRHEQERPYKSRNPFVKHYPDFYLSGEIVHFRSMSFSSNLNARSRLIVTDKVRYSFPKKVVQKIIDSKSSTFFHLFKKYDLKWHLFYLQSLFKIFSHK